MAMPGRMLLVCGSDDYLVAEKARSVIAEWVPESERDLGLEIIDGNVDTADAAVGAVRQCCEALQTMGFFGGGKTVWLRDAVFLAGGGRSFGSERVRESVAGLAALVRGGLGEGQALLLSTCEIPRNSALFRAFSAADAVVDFGAAAKSWERDKSIRENLASFLARFGLKMDDPEVRDAFLARVGSDTRTILQELEKLRNYRGGPGAVTVADIEAITSIGREAEAWDLTDALGSRDVEKLLVTLRRLEGQGDAPIMLSAMIEGRVRDLIILRCGIDEGWLVMQGRTASWGNLPREAELALGLAGSLHKQSAYRLGRLAEQAARYSMAELRAARHYLMEMREAMVSGGLDAQFLLETTLLKIIGAAPRGRPGRKAG